MNDKVRLLARLGAALIQTRDCKGDLEAAVATAFAIRALARRRNAGSSTTGRCGCLRKIIHAKKTDLVLPAPYIPERLDAQMLLDLLEEQFHLPAALVEGADGGGGQGEIIGDEDQRLVGLGIVEADSAQMVGIVPLDLAPSRAIVWSQMMPVKRSVGAE